MSEFLREYPTIVVEPDRPWEYFNVFDCLKTLPWSLNHCYAHIRRPWLDENPVTRSLLFTRHAVVQLALYTCYLFRDVPPDSYPFRREHEVHIIDEDASKDKQKKQRIYACRSVISLVEALATAFISYEDSCEYSYGWRAFQTERDMSIQFLKKSLRCWEAQKRRRITPEHPDLYHNRKAPAEIRNAINFLQSLTEHDYEGAGWPTNNPRHPVTHARKWWLFWEMDKAFQEYTPTEWPQEASYRALAAIANQMWITNTDGKDWKPNAVKGLLRRGPGPNVVQTTPLTRPNLHLWYMKLK